MDNGVNNSNNQAIPGVKVVMPNNMPVDATTNDVGAVASNARAAVVSAQQVTPAPQVTAVAPTSVNQAAPSQTVQATVSASTAPVASSSVVPVVTGEVPNVLDAQPNKISKEKKTKNKLSLILIIIIALLLGGCGFLWFYHQQEMMRMNARCTPVSTTEGTKELGLDSTIVQDLYSKVYTTIREDLGQSELNDELRIYLAYRQIATTDMYESNCNLFKTEGIDPFTCKVTTSFVPKAFKEETLQLEVKKLFGDYADIQNQNIQLGNSCIGGFQYIEERGEYVQGQCASVGATMYRVEKELISATSTESTIVLREDVKYYGAEGLELPSRLVSGVYKYTFKLDMNYNYIYISKELEQ